MTLRGSRVCRNAQRDAKAEGDPNAQKLIDCLNEPIRLEDTSRIVRRVERLIALFNGLDPRSAALLRARLNNAGDPLSQLFDCELSTAFRAELRTLLAKTESPGRAKPVLVPKKDSPPPPPTPVPQRVNPPPQTGIIMDPPPRNPGSSLIPNVPRYLHSLLEWIRRRQQASLSEAMRKALGHLEEAVKAAITIATGAVAAGAILYFAYNIEKAELILSIGPNSPRGADHLDILRVIDHFSNSNEKRDLERNLREINSALDEIDEIEENERIEQQLREQQGGRVEVDPRTRGFAIEDYRLEVLSQKGFDGLPPNYPAIDGVRGASRRVGQKTVYQNAEGISIKSTQITDPGRLLSYFRNTWLKPLVEKAYTNPTQGNVLVKSLRSKLLHVVFEEGSAQTFTRATYQAIRSMQAQCRANKIQFEWFIFASGSEEPGDQFIQNLLTGGH